MPGSLAHVLLRCRGKQNVDLISKQHAMKINSTKTGELESTMDVNKRRMFSTQSSQDSFTSFVVVFNRFDRQPVNRGRWKIALPAAFSSLRD